ncbi:unnamed protein product [Bursaphelenchus xylophilus]|uniref:(pine wood nematode) hypothetical protein n=1 Tax=Bursaphelenchus xylophilus TaxID=6326 RepID=A0A1I7SFA4_BURXY|nr:unnamed protein product [Bursaphelenchus xylophilus]CAG9130438.1 unnamed protein product [Bursaphelenchus xylophilus]
MNQWAFVVNLGYSVFYIYTLWFDYQLNLVHPFLPIPGVYLSKLVWLTMVTFFSLTVYHSVGAVLALSTPKKNSKFMRYFDFVATSLLFPLATSVVVLFWSLFLYDQNTLIDEKAEFLLEHEWFNHALHTTPLIGMTLDAIAWRHPRPHKKSALKAIFIFTVVYLIDIHLVWFVSGFWAYPILGQLNNLERLAFILVCCTVIFAAFLISDAFNAMLQPKKKKN